MRHTIHTLAAGLLITAMAGPLWAQEGSRSMSGATVRVSVVDGEVRVSTATLTLPAGSSTINWQLATTGWRFAAGSIDLGEASAFFTCRVVGDGAAYTCTRNANAQRGRFEYRIQLSNGGPLVEPPQPNVYISLE